MTKEEEINIRSSASCWEMIDGFEWATMTNPSCGHRLAAGHAYVSIHHVSTHALNPSCTPMANKVRGRAYCKNAYVSVQAYWD